MVYVVRTENSDGDIMVSASHNSYYDNGIKVMNGNGYKISGIMRSDGTVTSAI